MKRWFQVLLFIAIVLSGAACFENPTAPSKKEKPVMILNPDLQGIA